MKIHRLNIDIRKSDISDEWLTFTTTVNVCSSYLGRQVYSYRNIIDKNDFDELFSIMMRYAEYEIKEVVNKEHISKLKKIKGSK